MFKAMLSILFFVVITAGDIYMFQDFKMKYLIMIIPVTLFAGVVAWINVKDVIDDIINTRKQKTQETKTSTTSTYGRNFCIRDEEGTIWCLSHVDEGNKNTSDDDSHYSGKNFRKTSPEDIELAAYIQTHSEKDKEK